MEITRLLKQCQQGNNVAFDELYSIVYKELHKIAHKQLQNIWNVETLCTTALVNEVYLKLSKYEQSDVKDRYHFYAIAAKAMRQILINYAEQKQSKKRGGDWNKVTEKEPLLQSQQNLDFILSVNSAINELEAIDQNLSLLVQLKFYVGLTEEEIAEVQGVSARTIRRNWRKAKALLTVSLQ